MSKVIHFSVLVHRTKWSSISKIVHKENGTIWQKGCCWNLQKAVVQSSEPRVHRLEVSSRAKAVKNCRSTIVPAKKRLRLFRIIVSANQFSLHGTVAAMCEEYDSLHERTG